MDKVTIDEILLAQLFLRLQATGTKQFSIVNRTYAEDEYIEDGEDLPDIESPSFPPAQLTKDDLWLIQRGCKFAVPRGQGNVANSNQTFLFDFEKCEVACNFTRTTFTEEQIIHTHWPWRFKNFPVNVADKFLGDTRHLDQSEFLNSLKPMYDSVFLFKFRYVVDDFGAVAIDKERIYTRNKFDEILDCELDPNYGSQSTIVRFVKYAVLEWLLLPTFNEMQTLVEGTVEMNFDECAIKHTVDVASERNKQIDQRFSLREFLGFNGPNLFIQ